MLRRNSRIKRCPLVIQRQPLSGILQFQSCNLCYGKPNCCPHISSCCVPIVIPQNYVYWTKAINNIQSHRNKGDHIRLVTEWFLPQEVIWAAAYSELNVLQANVNVLQKWDSLKWAVALAHTAERCGVECLLMLYPIIPLHVKTYQVLQLIDAVGTCSHCKIMIRFGDFINYGLAIRSGFINLRGRDTPLSLVNRIKGDLWGCTDEYKSQFMEYLRFYTDANKIDLRVCEVIR